MGNDTNVYVRRTLLWAKQQPEVRSVILVGSQTRIDHPADKWSDIDFQVFVTNPAPFLSSNDWVSMLGAVWLCLPYQQHNAEPERLVILEGGQKVDFHFFPISELVDMVQKQSLQDVYHRGYEILLDKDGLAIKIPPCPYTPPPYQNPSPEEFLRNAEFFWFEALQVAKMLGRQELWAAKRGEHQLIRRLEQVLEWHARAISHGKQDTWHAGRFLLEWTDETTRDTLNDLYSHFTVVDSRHSLWAMICLFSRLATETAVLLGYNYPALLDQQVSCCISEMMEEDD